MPDTFSKPPLLIIERRGRLTFLDIAILADHITRVFGPGKREGVPGHPEVEMALVELYIETNDQKYLDLAKFFIDERVQGPYWWEFYHIDHKTIQRIRRMLVTQ